MVNLPSSEKQRLDQLQADLNKVRQRLVEEQNKNEALQSIVNMQRSRYTTLAATRTRLKYALADAERRLAALTNTDDNPAPSQPPTPLDEFMADNARKLGELRAKKAAREKEIAQAQAAAQAYETALVKASVVTNGGTLDQRLAALEQNQQVIVNVLHQIAAELTGA